MSLEGLRVGVMALVFVAIFAAIGAIVLDGFSEDLTADSYAANITEAGLEGVGNTSAYFGTIGTILAVAAILSIVVGAFMVIQR